MHTFFWVELIDIGKAHWPLVLYALPNGISYKQKLFALKPDKNVVKEIVVFFSDYPVCD